MHPSSLCVHCAHELIYLSLLCIFPIYVSAFLLFAKKVTQFYCPHFSPTYCSVLGSLLLNCHIEQMLPMVLMFCVTSSSHFPVECDASDALLLALLRITYRDCMAMSAMHLVWNASRREPWISRGVRDGETASATEWRSGSHLVIWSNLSRPAPGEDAVTRGYFQPGN